MREVLACERRAWEWARDNALIWTPTMEREAEAGIASYEAHLAGATKDYFYKRVLELVNDLGLGDPVGPEIVRAHTQRLRARTAVRGAERGSD